MPAALPAFRTLVAACTTSVPMASRAAASRLARAGEADLKGAPILASAVASRCAWLITFNLRDYRTDRIRVEEPGAFLEDLRARFASGWD
ncbi:MAG: hypothetical protein ACRDGD_11015 [Candidatus Limnocylindria bacterium]